MSKVFNVQLHAFVEYESIELAEKAVSAHVFLGLGVFNTTVILKSEKVHLFCRLWS